ncbi:XrtA/PEP-CTERM system TPR-repeat protein PrsT [Thalassotalea sp. PLHSN55]|uniref:XrtA/PEP-CTERM system TPR-repeat protein PrsT n=1 Tax=Thalassotalea sp. PLHSN55 TaxID=3435888 RepID=UPI003F845FFE
MNKCTVLLSFITPLVFSANSLALSNHAEHYENALQAFHQKNIDDAFIHIKNALKSDPDNLPAKLLLAEIFIEQGEYELAEQELLDAKQQNVDINLIIKPLGTSLLLQTKFEQALTLVKPNELNNQGKRDFNLIKAKAYQGLEQFDQAEQTYHLILSQTPNNTEAMLGLVSVYIYLENSQQAQHFLEKAAPLAAGNARFWRLKGIMATQLNQIEQALEHFKRADKLAPNNIANYRGIANSYVSLGKFPQANNYIDKILAISPKNPQIQLLKSSVLNELEQAENSSKVLTQLTNQLSAIDESYLHSQPQLLLIDAMTSYQQQNWEQARIKFQIYLEQKPQDMNATMLLADAYMQLEQPRKALTLLSNNETHVLRSKENTLVLADLYLQFKQNFKADYVLSKLRNQYKDDVDVLILSARVMDKTARTNEALELLEQSGLTDNDRINHSLAILYYQSGQLQKSLEKTTSITHQFPDNISYQLLHARILISLQQYADAKAVITEVYQKNPNNPKAKASFATLQLNLGETDKAHDLFKSLAQEQPNNGEYQLTLAQIDYQLGKVEQAISALETLTKNTEVRADALHQLGRIYFQEKQFEQSLLVVKQTLKANRLDTNALTLKYQNLFALGQMKDAKHQLSILQGLWNDNPEKLLQLSRMQRQVNDLAGAEENLTRAQKLLPNAFDINIATIKLKTQLGKYGEASALLSALKKTSHKNHPALLILAGDIASAEKEFDAAFSLYQKALTKDDRNTVALMKLNSVSNLAPRVTKFTQLLTDLVNKYPDRAFQQHMLADHLMLQKDYVQAKFQYQQLLTKDIPTPKRALALNNMANIYVAEQDYESAIEFSKNALSMLPSHPSIIDTLGWAHTLSGDNNQGLTYLRQAYTMASSSPDIQYHIGYTLAKLNRKEEAQNMLEKVVALPNEFPEHALAQSLLSQLMSE